MSSVDAIDNAAPRASLWLLVAVVVSAVLISLLAIELLFRGFGALRSPPIAWNDRPPAYFIPQGATTFQDLPYSKVKPADTFRVAVVGDSFTFAPFMQLDDTFVKRIERWLNFNRQRPRVEVINYGVPRYSTSHEVDVVRQAIDESADLVILQITLNDPEIKPFRPTGLNLDYNTGAPRVDGGVFRYWKSAAWVYERLLNARVTRDYEAYYLKLFEGKKTWNNFESSVGRIVGLSKKGKVPLVAVVFPTFGYTMGSAYPFMPLHQKIASLLSSHAIPLLDLAEKYTAIPVDRLQVIPGYDRHPNEIAHRIAAEAIIEWLGDAKLVPESALPRSQRQRIGIVLEPPLSASDRQS